MDRFIAKTVYTKEQKIVHLKSNMDRFIALCLLFLLVWQFYLKSNMDRFIVLASRKLIGAE